MPDEENIPNARIGSLVDTLLSGALPVDLEFSQRGKLLKLGAVLGDRVLQWPGVGSKPAGLEELARLARGARFVLGHNLLRHDLPLLRETAPRHQLLRLPVVDTLVLSPIAFPENPYHRLVKDYKLVSESVNDPVADARQASVLFRDEFKSLAGLRQTEPGLFELLHFVLTTPGTGEDPAARGIVAGDPADGGRQVALLPTAGPGAQLSARTKCGIDYSEVSSTSSWTSIRTSTSRSMS